MVDVVCIGPYLLFFSPSPRLGFWSSYSGGDLYYAGRGLTGSVIAGYRISHAGPPNTRLITAETGEGYRDASTRRRESLVGNEINSSMFARRVTGYPAVYT